MLKFDIAKQYRTKYGEGIPTLAVARIMYKENISVFNNLEDARGALRRIEGKSGDRNRKNTKDNALFIKESRPYNPYKLPDSEETEYTPYIIEGHKKIAVFNDIHAGYHSVEALSVAIQEAKSEKVDAVLLNGDSIDFYQLSRFEKDPRKRSIAHELETTRSILGILKKELKCKIYFKEGNHEERLEKYLFVKAPELLGISEFKLSSLLRFDEFNVTHIGEKKIIKLNSLNAIHGHEFSSSFFSPVNVARGLFLRGKVSAIQGHCHATSEHSESDMNGKATTTWSIGCLCELHPMYMPLNKWNHGFAIVDLNENGVDYHVNNIRIYKGKRL